MPREIHWRGPSVLSIGCRPDQAVDEGMGPTFTVRKGGARRQEVEPFRKSFDRRNGRISRSDRPENRVSALFAVKRGDVSRDDMDIDIEATI